jgi:hypothetical protein
MANRFSTTIRESTDLIETGLRLLDGAFRQMRHALQPRDQRTHVHTDAMGPRNVDGAVSELSNRVTRLSTMTAVEDVPNMWREVLEDARACFTEIERPAGGTQFGTDDRPVVRQPRRPASAARPGQSSHLARRGLRHIRHQRPRVSSTTRTFMRRFSTAKSSARYAQRLERNPGDSAARIELARTLIKCGLYHDAIRELEVALPDPRVRPEVLHELAVASFRAGPLHQRRAVRIRLDGNHRVEANAAAALAGVGKTRRLRARRSRRTTHAGALRQTADIAPARRHRRAGRPGQDQRRTRYGCLRFRW